MRKGLFFILVLAFFSCRQNNTLFTRLPQTETGIDFANIIQEGDPQFNILSYPYFYNGGGVAVGDINNDGLPDIAFTGNMVNNRLYLNKGNFTFEDITPQSHIADAKGWCTGIVMADVNSDGWLDIYICRSGNASSTFRSNLLYLNNHNNTFTESARKYGIADMGYSTQASFFDYDKDGDLDMMLINQSQPQFSKGRNEYVGVRTQAADSLFANKLFRNDGDHFTDVSRQAGISSTVLSFSLGVSTADINSDGWPDIYISNDFKEPDYLYINNGDGTFTDSLAQKIGHTSLYGMGVDIADYNNDGYPDIVQMDMLPEGNEAQKMHLGADNFEKFQYLFTNGMPYQYMKNSLQKNNGDGTFSEIGQFAGVSNTDWSWSPFFADLDNDGNKDLFVSNGYKRDNTNMQFLMYSMGEADKLNRGGALDVNDYIAHMPSIVLPNYVYRNDGNGHFSNAVQSWGFADTCLSNGAIYADLDNDGDVDIITNNVDAPAGMYRNNSNRAQANHYLQISLQGSPQNKWGIGSKLYVYTNDTLRYFEQLPTRGYQSAVTSAIHVGLGNHSEIDSIRIVWPNDATQLLTNIKSNQTLTLTFSGAHAKYIYPAKPSSPLFAADDVISFLPKENVVNDFTRQILLPRFYSHNGPCMAAADVNGDGREDVYIGGSAGNAGALFLQDGTNHFHCSKQMALAADSASEDTDAQFFDANGDGKPDLYIASGGYDNFEENSPLLADRLYLNDGKGNFLKQPAALPQNFGSTSCVRACDIDGDGDIDLFVGGTVVPGNFPKAGKSSLYINDGKGSFSDETNSWNPALNSLGMVTDAVWADVTGDTKPDLIVAGEWMAPTIFENKGNKLAFSSLNQMLENKKGLWNTIAAADWDKDGKTDLIIGNYGTNTQLSASGKEPLQLFATDIDGNGSVDPVLTGYIKGKSYPFVSMDDIIMQVPALRKKFNDYPKYTTATIEDIIPAEKLSSAKPLNITTLQTLYLRNTGNGFEEKTLPQEVQFSSVYALLATDFNSDGNMDLLLFGNNTYNRIRLGKQDANHGILLRNDGKGNFRYVPQPVSGLQVKGDVRSALITGNHLLIGSNGLPVLSYKLPDK